MVLMLKLTVDAAKPVLRGHDHFWRVIRTLGADGRSFTASQIGSLSQEPHPAAITAFLRRLMTAGYVERDGVDGSGDHVYRLLKSPEAAPRVSRDGIVNRPKSARQQMWNIMRSSAGRQGFSYTDLMVLASTEDVPVKANTAKSYIKELKGRYLLQLDPGGGRRPALWRLRPAMNTGPLPPAVLRAKVVYDQNQARVIGEVVAEEDLQS